MIGRPATPTPLSRLEVEGDQHDRGCDERVPESAEARDPDHGHHVGVSRVIHLYARRENGERAFSTERFQAVTDAVRARTDDVVVQHSTGGTGAPTELRAEPLRTDPPPEMASLDMGPANRGERLTSENTRATVATLREEMVERGIVPEPEAFDNGHLNEARAIADEFADSVSITLILGPGTLTPPSPRSLLHFVDHLPAGTEFTTLGFGRHQLPLSTLSCSSSEKEGRARGQPLLPEGGWRRATRNSSSGRSGSPGNWADRWRRRRRRGRYWASAGAETVEGRSDRQSGGRRVPASRYGRAADGPCT